MFPNNKISISKTLAKDGMGITYTLFDKGQKSEHYSLLISLNDGGTAEDAFIPDICAEAGSAENILAYFVKNSVLPCEIDALFSDGAFDALI